MAKITIDLPEELARKLEGLASARQKSVQQVALERLDSIAIPGTPAALLEAMRQPPHLSVAEVRELDAAISSGPEWESSVGHGASGSGISGS